MLTPPGAIEAVLFAHGERMGKKELSALLEIKPAELRLALSALHESLRGRGITLVETEEEVELRASAEAAGLIKKLRESELARDLGKASLETLAVIAYQDGATRGDIDWVRGVNSTASLRTLLMRGLIESSEDPEDKRRLRYALTTEALAHLGLSKKEGLPRYAELSRGTKETVEAGEKTEQEI